jgi:hypothetical protein
MKTDSTSGFYKFYLEMKNNKNALIIYANWHNKENYCYNELCYVLHKTKLMLFKLFAMKL